MQRLLGRGIIRSWAYIFLIDKENLWLNYTTMVSTFVDYFENLFTSSNSLDLDSILNLMGLRLFDDMVADLDRDFTSKEVKRVVH